MKNLWLVVPLLLTGCATFNHKLVNWPDSSETGVRTDGGEYIQIVGNPRITCFNHAGVVIADGLFVRIDDDRCNGDCAFLVVDEFGKDYVRVRNDQHNYCELWKK
ncbi:MAG: hypothetical protein ACREBR_05165 [bacterium]